MNKDLNAIAIFVAVADMGGFSKAAEKLGLTNSVISHHVSKLEERLGVTLFYRSTRRVSLSEQGRFFYSNVAGSLANIEQAINDILATEDDPVGTLNITMPAFMPEPLIEKALWSFVDDYPRVELNLSYSDDRLELISNGIDLAFRVGELPSSNMKVKKMTDIELLIVAHPKFLPTLNATVEPSELDAFDFIQIKQLVKTITVTNHHHTQQIDIAHGRIRVDNIYAARDAALAGAGLAILPVRLCESNLAEKTLIRVLPEWALDNIPLFAVWNNTARRNSLTRQLLTHLEHSVGVG